MILIKVEHQDFNTINFARTDFDSFVDWAVQESTSAVINRDEQTANIRFEVRGAFGWETRWMTVRAI